MLRRKIIYILVLMLILPTVVSAVFPTNTSTRLSYKENSNVDYTHNILGEFFTYTTCEPCKYAHDALKKLYKGEWHPFYYISMVYDVNEWAKDRHDELGIVASPTVAWDGGYIKDQGIVGGVEGTMAKYNTSIIACGNRNVKDIDLSLDVEWLGAVNPDPDHNATNVIVEKILEWDVTAMDIDVEVTNNEASQYNGYLRVYVTELNSSYWQDTNDLPYTFAFLDYAWNEDVTITSGNTWSDSVEWDGVDHHNGKGEFYDEIYQDNAMVIATIFDEDNNDYADETVGVRAGVDTDPKVFDIYFGNTTPPPKVKSNTSDRQYDPDGLLDFYETYYWKLDVWDNLGNKASGDIWNFTTRENNPPDTPYGETPYNNSPNVPINTNLSWICSDPDWDDVFYDVYFGIDIFNLPKVSANQTNTNFNPPGELDFDTNYFWKIVAWDEYGLSASGPLWNFRTQINLPPDPASDPFPENESKKVSIDVILSWNGTDPNPGDKLKYDVYFDDAFPLKQWEYNQSENEWEPESTLIKYQTYYWQIVTWDSGDPPLSTPGPIWHFETGEQYKPTAPVIDGPKEVVKGVEYSYTFNSTDENGDKVMYHVDWGDLTSDETDYHPEGEAVTLSHAWDDPDEYYITAYAIDASGNKGPTSNFRVIVPKNKAVNFNFKLLNCLFERFPHMFPILRQLLKL